MPILPSSGAPWIEPAGTGAALAARVVSLRETSTDLFEVEPVPLTGAVAQLAETDPGAFAILSDSNRAVLVETAPSSGIYDLVIGGVESAVLVETAAGVFEVVPGATRTAEIYRTLADVHEIIPLTAYRASLLMLGSGATILY